MSVNFCPNCGERIKVEANFCSNCGYKIAELKKASSDIQSEAKQREPKSDFKSKRDKILDGGKSKKSRNLSVYLLLLIIIGFMIFMVYNSLPSYKNPVIEAQPKVTSKVSYSNVNLQMFDIKPEVRDGKIIVPLDVVIDKKLVGFQYIKGNIKVPLLAYISPEGKLVTAVSICEPCNSERFYTEEDEIVCNACGTRWRLKNLEGISGACQQYPPDPIPSTIVGNEIQIDESIVINWRRRI